MCGGGRVWKREGERGRSPMLRMCLSISFSSFSCTRWPRGRKWKTPAWACSHISLALIPQNPNAEYRPAVDTQSASGANAYPLESTMPSVTAPACPSFLPSFFPQPFVCCRIKMLWENQPFTPCADAAMPPEGAKKVVRRFRWSVCLPRAWLERDSHPRAPTATPPRPTTPHCA